jgi:heme-degrading monooxygenase HmoA
VVVRPLNFTVRRHRQGCATREGNVISRQWRGLAHANQAQNYVEHLRTETFPALRKVPGFVDASILSRTLTDGVEFLVVTRWESLDAIAKFAGADPEAAVVPAEVAALMIDYDRRVRHFEVIG